MKIKIGDLVSVQHPGERRSEVLALFTIVTDMNVREEHPNKLQLIEVLVKDGRTAWYPIGYIKVENESR